MRPKMPTTLLLKSFQKRHSTSCQWPTTYAGIFASISGPCNGCVSFAHRPRGIHHIASLPKKWLKRCPASSLNLSDSLNLLTTRATTLDVSVKNSAKLNALALNNKYCLERKYTIRYHRKYLN